MPISVVKYQPEKTQTFLGSPSICRLPDGSLVATHDYFGSGCPRNHEGEESLTSVYRSEDDGKSWLNVTHIMNAYWGNLFMHRGELYHFGITQQYGSIVIRKSTDGGLTWTHPKDRRSGLLFPGGEYHRNPNYHCAPMPVLVHNGRLYRAFEDCREARWGSGFASLVVSISVEDDLLDAANWTMSNKVAFDPTWVPDSWVDTTVPGWLEGNVVVAPDADIWNILRFNSGPVVDKAARILISPDGRDAHFEPENGFIDFPGGMTKFTIRFDPVTKQYISLANGNTDPKYCSQRNVLSLFASENLINWRHVRTLLEDDSGLRWEDSVRLTGFQYVDWHFDGDDIIYLVRSASRGARNFHDANRITFHILRNFRKLLQTH